MSEASDLPEEGQNPFRRFTREALECGSTENQQKKKEIEREVFYKKKIQNESPDPMLEEGMRLPYRLRNKFPEGLLNTPIEDVDPFYKNQMTFVMINNRRKLHRFNAKSTFWIFDPFNPIRRGALYITIHPLFSIFTMITIFINALFLSVPYSDSTPSTLRKCAEASFLTVYTVEMIVKILARGFILHPFAYLRDEWNWVDFLVTLFSYLAHIMDIAGIRLLQAFRMLRMMKIDLLFPGFRTLVRAIFKSDQKLRSPLIFILSILTIVAVWFMQNYMGVLTQKCIRQFPEDGSWGNLTDENWDRFNNNNSYNLEENVMCGNSTGAGQCPAGFVCLQGYGSNPNYGYTNFDSFGWSMLGVFRLMTQDYWENLYEMVLRSAGPWHMIFFIFVIFLVSFNFLNVILAIVASAFNEIRKQEEDDKEAEKSSKNKLSSDSRDTTLDIEDVNEKNQHFSTKNENERNACTKITDYLCIWNCCHCWTALQQFVASIVLNPFAELFFLFNILLNTILMVLDHHDMPISLERFLSTGNYFCVLIFVIEVSSKIIAMSPKYYFQKPWNKFDFFVVLFCVLEFALEDIQGLSILRVFRLFRLIRMLKIFQLTRSSWPVLNYLISVISKTLGPLTRLIILLFIVTFIFGLIGMHLLGGLFVENVYRFPEYEMPRWNFTDLMHSFMVIFRAICGEWIETMWDCMLVGDVTVIPFYISVVIIGGFVVKNIFLSLILHNFELCDRSTPEEDEDVKKILNAINKIGFSKFRKNGTGPDAERRNQKTDDIDPTNWRSKIFTIIDNKYFETVIITIIALSSLALTLEDVYLPDRPLLQNILHHMDTVFMILFTIEMIIMWLGLGFKKYFASAWCWLDFTVVLALVINFVCTASGPYCFGITQVFRFMRILRLFRLLKVWSKCEHMKIVLNTLVKAIPDIFGTLILCFLIWLVFAIMGVQLFAGKFYKCVDDYGTTLSFEIIPNFNSCMVHNYTWENSVVNFDHIGNAYLSLVQVATFKGWIQIMNDAIDSRFVDSQPIREVNIYMYWYFIIFIIYGVFLTLNMFVGIIVRSYNQEKKILLEQKTPKHYNAIKRIESKKLKKAIPKPNWKFPSVLYETVTHKYFEVVMMVVIALNVLIMTSDHYQVSEGYSIFLDFSNFIFILIFSAECLLKMVALRHHYFLDSWNWFDLTLVLQQMLFLFTSDIFEKYLYIAPIPLMRVIRILKIRKNLRLVKSLKNIRIVFSTLSNSLRALFSVGCLLFVITSVYAVFGMLFFKHVKDEAGLNDLINFKTFGQSMITLFQYSTWAGWDGALIALKNEEDCKLPDFGEPGNCGNAAIAIAFLLSYIFVSFMIMNVYIAVVLANYFEAIVDEEEGITDDDVNMIYEVWQKFDPYATGYIRLDQLTDFLEKLEPPFQFRKYNQARIERLQIPCNKDNQVHYKDVLKALMEDFFSEDNAELINS